MEIDSVNEYGQDFGYSSLDHQQQLESRFHGVIFSPANSDERFSKKHVFDLNHSALDRRVDNIFSNSSGTEKVRITGDKSSANVAFEAEWGGKEGAKYSASGSAKTENKDGKYVEVKVKQDSNGKGSASASAGQEKSTQNNETKKK